MSERLSPEAEVLRAEIHADPYAHMLFRLWTEAWATGYEQALRDAEKSHGLDSDVRYRTSFRERTRQAAAVLTDKQERATVEYLIAMAAAGPLLPRTWKTPENPGGRA